MLYISYLSRIFFKNPNIMHAQRPIILLLGLRRKSYYYDGVWEFAKGRVVLAPRNLCLPVRLGPIISIKKRDIFLKQYAWKCYAEKEIGATVKGLHPSLVSTWDIVTRSRIQRQHRI